MSIIARCENHPSPLLPIQHPAYPLGLTCLTQRGPELNRQLGAHSKMALPLGNSLPGLLHKNQEQLWSKRSPLMPLVEWPLSWRFSSRPLATGFVCSGYLPTFLFEI
jgi:hypothetical protein